MTVIGVKSQMEWKDRKTGISMNGWSRIDVRISVNAKYGVHIHVKVNWKQCIEQLGIIVS